MRIEAIAAFLGLGNRPTVVGNEEAAMVKDTVEVLAGLRRDSYYPEWLLAPRRLGISTCRLRIMIGAGLRPVQSVPISRYKRPGIGDDQGAARGWRDG